MTLALFLSLPVGAETWTLVPEGSTFRAILPRAGVLKKFGHDHVIEVRGWSGSFELTGASADLTLAIDPLALEIDSDEARRRMGFKDAVKPKHRRKILEKMRGPAVLDVSGHARISFSAKGIAPIPRSRGYWHVKGALRLRGVEKELSFPVSVVRDGEKGWLISGRVELKPSDFGIAPVSVMGLVKTEDALSVRFRIRARPAGS